MNDDLWQMILGLLVRHGLTAAFGALLTYGLVKATDQDAFMQIGTGILMGAAGLAWSWWQKIGHARIKAQLDDIRTFRRQAS